MTHVLTGIDILIRQNFSALKGSSVGLVTNHTGLTSDLRSTTDVLHRAEGVDLVALFGPEHGVRGEVDENVADGIDPTTGLPVYSLFGERHQPAEEQLSGIDTFVFDIQDIGCRFYTYISTLGNVMEAAAKYGRRVVVLDRPNPITGEHIEGPLADSDRLSFTAYHEIPIRHGMTVGEMATLFNTDKKIGCDLAVVHCENWRRADWYDSTGLYWTNPSPNMRSLTQAALYPGVGLLEMTNISVGRGTDTPFEVIGAPYIDGRALAASPNMLNLPGIRFIPIRFTPRAGGRQGEMCYGVNLLITDRENINSVQIGYTIAEFLYRMYPEDWNVEKYKNLLAHQQTFESVVSGETYDWISSHWAKKINEFMAKRAASLLY